MNKILPILALSIIISCRSSTTSTPDIDTSLISYNTQQPDKIITDTFFNSLLLQTGVDSTPVGAGTGFLCKYKNKFYLVSCYHVFTNLSALDTTSYADNKALTPNVVYVQFMNLKKRPVIVKYDLLDKKNSRLFVSHPAFFHSNLNEYRVIDVAVLPIHIQKDVIINPINIDNIDTSWVINENDKIVDYGFPGESSANRYFADKITTLSSSNRKFTYQDFQVVTQSSTKDLQGASGSPVFLDRNNSKIFIGILNGGQFNSHEQFILVSRLIKILFDRSFK